MAGLGRQLSLSGRALARVLENPGLRRLAIAWTLSVAAQWALLVALLVYAYGAGGSLAVGVLGLFRTLPALVGVPLASAAGDRYPRVRVLLAAYVVATVASGAAAVALAAAQPLAVVFALAAVIAVSTAAIRPLQNSLLPSLARSAEELVATNVASSAGEGIGVMVGPAVAGLLVVAGPALAALAAAAAMAIASVELALVRIGPDLRPRPARGRGGRPSVEAVRSLLGLPVQLLFMAVFGVQPFVRGLLTVLAVVASIELLGLGEPGVGLLNSAVGLGGIAGAFGAIVLIGRARLVPAWASALVFWGLPIVLVGLVPLAPVAVAGMVVIGCANAILDVAGFTLLQRTIANDVRAGILGLFEGYVQAMAGLGGIVAPLLIAVLGIRAALVAGGLILPVLALATLPTLRRMDAISLVPVRRVALLRGVPMFATLPMTAVEQLAEDLVPVVVPAGRPLLREGEVGDRFYVIDEGHAEVSQAGRTVRTIGPGAYVGEIALLRGVPRTASVTALGELHAFALDSATFVAAVTGDRAAAASADVVVEARLANADE